MWVNEKEEEELMFDWGDKNIDQYIPRKQESYSVSQTSDHKGTNIELDSVDAAKNPLFNFQFYELHFRQ